MMEIQAEIEYVRENSKVHSDIEPVGCNSAFLQDDDYRKYLHKCLDEWLDNSNGTGGFYIKDVNYKFDFE